MCSEPGPNCCCAELVATASVEIELDGIAVPDCRSDVGRVLIEAAKTDVEIVVVPKIQEFGASIGEVGMADVDRRDKCSVPVVELAVHLDRLRGLRNQADNRLLLSVGDGRNQGEEQDSPEARAGRVHGWLRNEGFAARPAS